MNTAPRPVRIRSARPGAARLAAAALLGTLANAPSALAQNAGDAATIAELRRQLEAMQRRLDALEARTPAAPRRPETTATAPVRAPRRATEADAQAAQTAAQQARAAAAEAQAAQRSTEQFRATVARDTAALVEATAPIPGLLPPEPMGTQFEDALRSDLPGIAIRIPGTDTQVRLYGFAKLAGYADFNGRNQTDAPAPAAIPLTGSAADLQGGDFGLTGRFSRFGVDTRTLTDWGTLETRLEGDFGGGAATSSNAVFRLRQAWAELGTERFRVLAGQANSLWNEGLFETLIDATNLNQSFVRQAQLRVTGRLTPSLTGQLSIETPETQFTSAPGVLTPGNTVNGGPSIAFNSVPDLLGRLTWRQSGAEIGVRTLLRELQIRTAGVNFPVAAQTRTATGWGFAGHARLPMRLVSDAFGTDELLGLAYYGEGIGRYFAGNTSGQDALSTIGLPVVVNDVSLDAIPTWGATVAYRRFWTPALRSNFAYSYARQIYPGYALDFVPGSTAALSLNKEMQQVFANLIWSPFATVRDGVFGAGWLDVGLEYVMTRRDLFGGAGAAGGDGVGRGIANRLVFASIARF